MKAKLFLGLTLAAFLFGGNVYAAAKTRKISIERAEEIALKRVSGEIEQADAVMRHRRQTYSIFIKRPDGVTAHVLVSEKGRIKRVMDETPATAKIK